jgi:hypothetical protein
MDQGREARERRPAQVVDVVELGARQRRQVAQRDHRPALDEAPQPPGHLHGVEWEAPFGVRQPGAQRVPGGAMHVDVHRGGRRARSEIVPAPPGDAFEERARVLDALAPEVRLREQVHGVLSGEFAERRQPSPPRPVLHAGR